MATSIIDAVIWRRLDLPGHDACTLRKSSAGYALIGSALFSHGRGPCSLHYAVYCDLTWRTTRATVRGTMGRKVVDIDIARSSRHWKLNGVVQDGLADCHDVDLSFTPATNILPVKRLGLRAGTSIATTAAWLRFPSMTLGRLEQVYKHLGNGKYGYSSFNGKFAKTLSLRPSGLVSAYPTLWRAERVA